MNKIIGIVLIVIGGFLFVQGLNRQDSLAGEASELGTSIANSVDGGTRTPQHVFYMVGGGVLVLIGAVVALRKTPSV